MPKPKKAERLTPIPRPRKARPAPDAARLDAGGAAAPDLSHICEGLRPLAVPIGDLLFDPANARKHGEDNIEAIKGSLAVYGQRRPAVVNRRTGVLEAGNGMLKAALSLNWTHLAAVYVDDDPATAAGFSIADNRASDLAGWDKEALDALLRDVNTNADPRLDQMLSDLAREKKLYPADDPPRPDGEQPEAPAEPKPEEGQPAALRCPACGHEWDGRLRIEPE